MIRMALLFVLSTAVVFAAVDSLGNPSAAKESTMQLGNFSVSLSVADLAASREFYETLGFEIIGGDAEQGFLILRNGTTKIGLFHGKFEGNILTFNPGWSDAGEPLDDFTDVRAIQKKLTDAGIELALPADPEGTGPAHVVFYDPDGNCVMLDQHVPRPEAK